MDIIEKERRCIIIPSYSDALLRSCIAFHKNDYIICADGGYSLALEEQITPNLIVGDFDSFRGDIPSTVETVRVASEKDDTDTMLCLKIGIERGFKEFILCGGIGGRLDHTIGNLQAAAYAIAHGTTCWIVSGNDRLTFLSEDKLSLTGCHALKAQGYGFSLFSYSDQCTGVSICGAYYPLTDATLNNCTPLGVSNEFLEDTVTIENRTGTLLIILSRECNKIR